MKKVFRAVLASGALIAATTAVPASAAVRLDVQNGRLMGASGVEVGGKTYDVRFATGTCASVYGACTNARLGFNSFNQVDAASRALLSAVLIDSAAGNFWSESGRINGCGLYPNFCSVLLPFNVSEDVSFLQNAIYNSELIQYVGSEGIGTNFDNGYQTFAVFTPAAAAAVPEPASWAMLLIGFGVAGTAVRGGRVTRRVRFA